MTRKAVIAVGGNSLIRDKEHQSVPDQYQCIVETSKHICGVIEKGIDVVITHGNGPQVGFILLRSELSLHKLHPVPLDSCGADTQGAIGYQFQMALGNEFRRRGMIKDVATVVTQVLVDQNDRAFQKATKPIGPFLSEEEALKRKADFGWEVMEDAGRGWRRAVPSPLPVEIVEFKTIERLLNSGTTVIAVGGGGIPVIRNGEGNLQGTAAVIDKDHASALLASKLKADLLIISTAVEKVSLHYGTPQQRDLDSMTLEEAKTYAKEGHFKAGSMLPKIEAIIHFLEGGGKEAIITNPSQLGEAVDGRSGTRIVR